MSGSRRLREIYDADWPSTHNLMVDDYQSQLVPLPRCEYALYLLLWVHRLDQATPHVRWQPACMGARYGMAVFCWGMSRYLLKL